MKLICLVHFPDGTQAPSFVPGDKAPAAGVELIPGWIIDVLRPAKGGSYTKEGWPIVYEVWVERKPPEQVEP